MNNAIQVKATIVSKKVNAVRFDNGKIVKPKTLGVVAKARNAIKAVQDIVKSGLKIADKRTRLHRGKICKKCPYWKKDGNMGLGECVQCGCTKYKRLFEAQACPIKKW